MSYFISNSAIVLTCLHSASFISAFCITFLLLQRASVNQYDKILTFVYSKKFPLICLTWAATCFHLSFLCNFLLFENAQNKLGLVGAQLPPSEAYSWNVQKSLSKMYCEQSLVFLSVHLLNELLPSIGQSVPFLVSFFNRRKYFLTLLGLNLLFEFTLITPPPTGYGHLMLFVYSSVTSALILSICFLMFLFLFYTFTKVLEMNRTLKKKLETVQLIPFLKFLVLYLASSAVIGISLLSQISAYPVITWYSPRSWNSGLFVQDIVYSVIGIYTLIFGYRPKEKSSQSNSKLKGNSTAAIAESNTANSDNNHRNLSKKFPSNDHLIRGAPIVPLESK
jgi:hypothetical protein